MAIESMMIAAAKRRKNTLVAKRCPPKSISPGIIAKRIKNGDETMPHIDATKLKYLVDLFFENKVGMTIQKVSNKTAAIVHAHINKFLETKLLAPFSATVVPR